MKEDIQVIKDCEQCQRIFILPVHKNANCPICRLNTLYDTQLESQSILGRIFRGGN